MSAGSMTKSTISVDLAMAGFIGRAFRGPDAETDRSSAGRAGAERGTRADHRDDVVAADGARQFASARGDAALQAHRRAFVGGIWPSRQSGPAPADGRRSARRGCWARQGADQPG